MIKVCSNEKDDIIINLCIFIIFSCPFSSTAMAEDDERVVKVDSKFQVRVKNDLFFTNFFRLQSIYERFFLFRVFL